jgi:hypothetical protein
MRYKEILTEKIKQRLDAKCWKGKHKEGTKIKGGVRVNNCVPNESVAEDWQKVNKKDRTDGMSRKAVAAYRREHPGSKLKTAVTTKPSKLKKGSKASKRRKSYCSRSKGQMNMHNISCKKTPDKAICKARRRWNCESVEHDNGTTSYEHLISKRLKRILMSPEANEQDLTWAMEYTHDALADDYDDEQIPSRVYDARANAFNSAELSFEEDDFDQTLEHLRQFWRV